MLPNPWQWLKDVEPDHGQQCEWVILASYGADKGYGEWKAIDQMDPPEFNLPLGLRVQVKGFAGEYGFMVSDPALTAWRALPLPKEVE
jgi:hypothetical protein